MNRDELEKLAEAHTRDARDGSWCMNPKGAFLKGYDEGSNAAIDELIAEMSNHEIIFDTVQDAEKFERVVQKLKGGAE